MAQEQLFLRHYETNYGSSHHTQLVLPCSLRDLVLKDVYGGVTSGHFGEDKALGRLQERFYWPRFHTDVVSCGVRCVMTVQGERCRLPSAGHLCKTFR